MHSVLRYLRLKVEHDECAVCCKALGSKWNMMDAQWASPFLQAGCTTMWRHCRWQRAGLA